MIKFQTYVIGLLIVLSSCHGTHKKDESANAEWGKYYFEFDELTHYRIEIDEEKLLLHEDGNDHLSPKEKLQQKLIMMDTPKSITDTSFIAKLESIDFKKTKVSSVKSKQVKEISRKKRLR